MHSDTEQEADFPPAPLPPSCDTNTPAGAGDETTLMHDFHPESRVYIRSHSWCCTFYRFGQAYKDTYPPSYRGFKSQGGRQLCLGVGGGDK